MSQYTTTSLFLGQWLLSLLYMELAESTGNEKARAVLIDVANEEREHEGEFLTLLHELAPEEESFDQKGKEEVDEIFQKLKK